MSRMKFDCDGLWHNETASRPLDHGSDSIREAFTSQPNSNDHDGGKKTIVSDSKPKFGKTSLDPLASKIFTQYQANTQNRIRPTDFHHSLRHCRDMLERIWFGLGFTSNLLFRSEKELVKALAQEYEALVFGD
jgi:hypothetical protein